MQVSGHGGRAQLRSLRHLRAGEPAGDDDRQAGNGDDGIDYGRIQFA